MSNSNLPANISNMVDGLVQSVATVSSGGGEMYMKMTKSGRFVYGAEEIETEEGSLWAVNPAGFQHGWIAWGNKAHGTAGKMLGEHLGPAALPIFPEADLEVVKGTWSQQIAIQLRCVSGEDEGTQVLYKANSYGGRKAYGALLAKVVDAITSGTEEIVPVVTLESNSYKHDEYGEIFNPEFVVDHWVTMDGLSTDAETEEEEEEDTPPPKPTRKRKAESAGSEETGDEDQGKEEEAAAPPRRRRRRTAA